MSWLTLVVMFGFWSAGLAISIVFSTKNLNISDQFDTPKFIFISIIGFLLSAYWWSDIMCN